MRGKFNYITYLFLSIVLGGFLTVAIIFLPFFVRVILHSEENMTGAIVGLVFASLGVTYGIVVLADLLFNYRYKIEASTDGIIVTDDVLFKRRQIDFNSIKSMREDEYVYNVFLKSITVTLNSGKRYKMLNFFLWNYSIVKRRLQSQKGNLRSVKFGKT